MNRLRESTLIWNQIQNRGLNYWRALGINQSCELLVFFVFFQNIFMDSIQQMPQDVLHLES